MNSNVKNGSSVHRIYHQLKRMAINYTFRPKEPLNEVELAASLGVSRTPLREVLNRLVAEGLLDFIPRRGFLGRSLDTQMIYDLYEMRCGLEVISTKLATERATDEDLTALTHFWNTASKKFETDTATEFVRSDEQFHEQIAALSRNQEILHTLQSINARIHFVRQIFMEDPSQRQHTCEHHQAILAALKQRSADQAANCMYSHVIIRREQVVDVIKEGIARLYMNEPQHDQLKY